MPKVPLLWHWGARKEALELLEQLWVQGGDKIRRRLTEALTTGPPDDVTDDDDAKREVDRDSRIFDRIALLAQSNRVQLPPTLRSVLEAIRNRHPEWLPLEGERAKFNVWRFGVWRESKWGFDAQYSRDDLRAFSDLDQLVEVLCTERVQRMGLLNNWQELAAAEPERALEVVRKLLLQTDCGPADVWQATLWGLRRGIKERQLGHQLMELLCSASPELFKEIGFTRVIAALLEAASSDLAEKPIEAFWKLYNRALPAAEDDPRNADQPDNDRWVDVAINCALGLLATAFFNALFSYRLKVGQGVPAEHMERLGRLIGMGDRNHRLARVIAASRMPYLFAVDSDWTRKTLLPFLDWEDEDESTALWQGFMWRPRVGPDLWAEIRQPFLAAFTSDRLARLGEAARTIAQLLMLAGVEFRREDVPTDQARSAIKAMTNEMRELAIWWLWHYLSQVQERADVLWRERVQPWLKRVWPHEQSLRTPSLTGNFASLVIATSNAFPEAVAFVKPFLVRAQANLVVHNLGRSIHPDSHAEATLELLEAGVDLNEFWIGDDIQDILNRVGKAQPMLREDHVYRKFEGMLKARPL